MRCDFRLSTLRRTNNNDVKRRLEIPALHLNEGEHQQALDLFECRGVIDTKGKRFRHLAQLSANTSYN